jgi:hypothetical protein
MLMTNCGDLAKNVVVKQRPNVTISSHSCQTTTWSTALEEEEEEEDQTQASQAFSLHTCPV